VDDRQSFERLFDFAALSILRPQSATSSPDGFRSPRRCTAFSFKTSDLLPERDIEVEARGRFSAKEEAMRIAKHDKSYIIELIDSSGWRIRPADLASTLQWLPTTEIDVRKIEDEICSHALMDRKCGSLKRAEKGRCTKSGDRSVIEKATQPVGSDATKCVNKSALTRTMC
jgi:hypothetical protein